MSSSNFQIPQALRTQEADQTEGTFVLEPLERGYGTTIGNSIRRVLLSSMEGYAITGITISGVVHEFSTIPGVKEDVSEIILNLKQVLLKQKATLTEEKLRIAVKGQEYFKAGDIAKSTSTFDVLNPDLIICHTDPKTEFVIELHIRKGRGYVPAEEHTQRSEKGFIGLDATFTPIKNVSYHIEQPRIAEKYERLLLKVKTDATTSPEKALKDSANLLAKHFALFNTSAEQEKQQKQTEEENLRITRNLLQQRIEELGLPVRTQNCLKLNKVNNLGELVTLSKVRLKKFKNLGEKSLKDLEELVAAKKLHFGMDISPYKIDGRL